MIMTLNEHHGVRFHVVIVALTALCNIGSSLIKMLFTDQMHQHFTMILRK